MELYLSMAAFALASSITPGPVNLVALNCGARFGLRASGRHIAGATLGFTLLLLLIGLGLYELLERPGIAARHSVGRCGLSALHGLAPGRR